MLEICQRCDGTGVYDCWQIAMIVECPDCHGSGLTKEQDVIG